MNKRLTLTKLISYIVKKYETDEIKNDKKIEKNKILDDIKFKNLEYNEIKNLNDLPTKLARMFDPFTKVIKRKGSFIEDDIKQYSLYHSILYCLDDEYINLNKNQKIKKIKETVMEITRDINLKKLYDLYNYKELKWTKKELLNSITKYKNNKMVLRFISDYLNINIFVLDIIDDKIYTIFNKNFNRYKSSILMTYYDNVFQPLISENNNIWEYESDVMKKLINVEKNKINIFQDNFDDNIPDKIMELFDLEDIEVDGLNEYVNIYNEHFNTNITIENILNVSNINELLNNENQNDNQKDNQNDDQNDNQNDDQNIDKQKDNQSENQNDNQNDDQSENQNDNQSIDNQIDKLTDNQCIIEHNMNNKNNKNENMFEEISEDLNNKYNLIDNDIISEKNIYNENDNDIFVKKEKRQKNKKHITSETKITSEIKIENTENTENTENLMKKRKEILYNDINKIDEKLKLKEIQTIAKKYNILIENGITKTGKIKYKTKKKLIEELNNLKNNNI